MEIEYMPKYVLLGVCPVKKWDMGNPRDYHNIAFNFRVLKLIQIYFWDRVLDFKRRNKSSMFQGTHFEKKPSGIKEFKIWQGHQQLSWAASSRKSLKNAFSGYIPLILQANLMPGHEQHSVYPRTWRNGEISLQRSYCLKRKKETLSIERHVQLDLWMDRAAIQNGKHLVNHCEEDYESSS